MVLVELELLYRERLADFCRAAAAIAGDAELGRDAVQEAFARAVRKRRRYRGDGPLEAWVWRIVVNAARDARRKRVLLAEPGDAAAAESPVPPRLPLELLTERQREVLFLHYYADLDYATIAAALGISPGTVGATLSTARRTLRGALTQEVAS
jgi:RNA polymerase sigma-70 factor (ECF subfamily)